MHKESPRRERNKLREIFLDVDVATDAGNVRGLDGNLMHGRETRLRKYAVKIWESVLRFLLSG